MNFGFLRHLASAKYTPIGFFVHTLGVRGVYLVWFCLRQNNILRRGTAFKTPGSRPLAFRYFALAVASSRAAEYENKATLYNEIL